MLRVADGPVQPMTLYSNEGANLYVSEDNEEVIKMSIEERSPHTRHVTRSHTEFI